MSLLTVSHKSFKKIKILKNKVTTERYLWHVTNPGIYYERPLNKWSDHWRNKFINNIRKSIYEKGLTFQNSNAVYAHNGIFRIVEMYPLWLDNYSQIYMKDGSEISNGIEDFSWLKKFDFWRIDTEIFKESWYEDPFMKRDIDVYVKKAKAWNFVCTPHEIPPHALRLFKFDQHLYEQPLFVRGEGTVSVRCKRTLWDGMVPYDLVTIQKAA